MEQYAFGLRGWVRVSLVSMILGGALLACSGDVDDEPSATPSSTAAATMVSATQTPPPATTPAATATPASAGGDDQYQGYNIIGDFTYGAPIGFPVNLLMLVETGCTQCDSGPDALYRVWRNDGETHVELLVDAAIAGVEGAYLTSIAVSPTLHDIVVTVCAECGDAPLTASSTEVYRSIDGGVTWRLVTTTEAGEVVYARAITEDGIVMASFDGGLFYLRGDEIEPPAGAESPLHYLHGAGEMQWLANDGRTALDNTGSPIAVVEPGSLIDAVVRDANDPSRTVVGWGLNRVTGPFEGWAVTRVGPDGRQTGFRFDTYIAPVDRLDDGRILGRLSSEESPFGGIIGFIDVATGTLTPIHGPLTASPFEIPTGRNDPIGATTGPFPRVDTRGTSGCVPVRASLDLSSPEVVCAANGTLVYDLKGTASVGSQEWTRIRLLDGREGYAVSSYLSAE